MRQMATLGLLLATIAPSTGWAQAMVEVTNAPPPPPPPTVTQPRRGPSRYEVLIDAAPGVAVPLGGDYARNFGPSFTMDGHIGCVIWMRARRYALVPELSVGGTNLTANDDVIGGGFSRERGEAGMRVLVPLGATWSSTRAWPSVVTTSPARSSTLPRRRAVAGPSMRWRWRRRSCAMRAPD